MEGGRLPEPVRRGRADFGVFTKDGIDLAVEEINKAGGVKGKPIKVLYEDDKSNGLEANNKVLQLIDRDKVIALLGEVASERSKAGGIVANRKRDPHDHPLGDEPRGHQGRPLRVPRVLHR